MPNHVINELIFRNVGGHERERILTAACKDGRVDFEVLVPYPITAWLGGVGSEHKQKLPQNGLDWATETWGTKCNAYGQKPIESAADSLVLRFDTAWRPPYGWLVALLNTIRLPFEHNWLSEGESLGHSATWEWSGTGRGPFTGPNWKEGPCSDEMQKHLHLLRWGCEEFPPEEDE